MSKTGTCSTCEWCSINELKDMICVNGDSEYVADYVDETHWCEEYKKKKSLNYIGLDKATANRE